MYNTDATGRFTLLADSCMIESKPLLSKIMAPFGLPKGTAVMRDLQYRCAACMGNVPIRAGERGLGFLMLRENLAVSPS